MNLRASKWMQVLGVELCSPKRHAEVLTLSTPECDLMGH